MDNISCKCDEAENIRAGSIRFSMTESEKSVDSQARPGSPLYQYRVQVWVGSGDWLDKTIHIPDGAEVIFFEIWHHIYSNITLF